MIVPQYWAEGRIQHRQNGKQVTIRRFGWSDTSQDEAQTNADNRAREALQRLLAGEKLHRKEPKIPYNGAHGVPIREEIVERQGETIITRNGYGARCLNTPDVLFADIDHNIKPSLKFTFSVVGLMVISSVSASWLINSKFIWIAFFLALLVGGWLSGILHRAIRQIQGGDEKLAQRRINDFIKKHPDWNLRMYRTPAGMRVLVTHEVFSPNDPAVDEFFGALGVDPVYALMCRNQQCFRARVSAKPWRIGITDHMRPRPGVWPIAPERLPLRQAWVDRYESTARSYSACTFIGDMGSGVVHPKARDVRDIHDKLCKAESGLPMA